MIDSMQPGCADWQAVGAALDRPTDCVGAGSADILESLPRPIWHPRPVGKKSDYLWVHQRRREEGGVRIGLCAEAHGIADQVHWCTLSATRRCATARALR